MTELRVVLSLDMSDRAAAAVERLADAILSGAHILGPVLAIMAQAKADATQPEVNRPEPAPTMPRPPGPAPKPYFGGSARRTGNVSRFAGTSRHAHRETAALPEGHRAIVENRTLFPTRVFPVADVPRLLVSGHNSAKVGDVVRKGPWRGMPLYTLTLEERATCPDTCHLLRECYGNAMPLARRPQHGPELEARLLAELAVLQQQHRHGFVVRLHVLGDFYSPEYVRTWGTALERFPALHVFGYTARALDSEIGRLIVALNAAFPDRWVIRNSVPPERPAEPMQATTIWRDARGAVPEGIVCPAQTHDTEACATCGLCWSPAARDKRIVFIGHGMNRRGNAKPPADVEHAPGSTHAPRATPVVPPASVPSAPAEGRLWDWTPERDGALQQAARAGRSPNPLFGEIAAMPGAVGTRAALATRFYSFRKHVAGERASAERPQQDVAASPVPSIQPTAPAVTATPAPASRPAPIAAAPQPAQPPASAPAPLPPASIRKAPSLPAPQNGKVYARTADIAAWAAHHKLAFDGRAAHVEAINKFRRMMGAPPVVVDETAGAAA